MSDDIHIEAKLRSIEKKIEENTKMLRSMKRKQQISFWFGIIKILVIVGVFYYLYGFVEPILIQFKEVYTSVQGFSETADSMKGINVFDIFKQQ